MYKMTIVKLEDNLDYDKQLKEVEDRNRYSGMMGRDNYPSKTIEIRTLEVMIDEVEFIAIKKSVLETFK